MRQVMRGLILVVIGTLSLSGAQAQAPSADPTVMERIAQAAVERVLSRVLDVPVRVGSVRLDGKSEFLELKEFTIANPSGFKADSAISVGTVRVEATPRLLFSKEPLIRVVSVSQPVINVETGLKGSNILTLLRNAKKAGGVPEKKRGLAKDLRFRIEKGILEKAEVNMDTAFLKSANDSKKIDKLEMSFMGTDGRGVTAQEGMQQFFQRLMKELGILEESSTDTLPGLIGDILNR